MKKLITLLLVFVSAQVFGQTVVSNNQKGGQTALQINNVNSDPVSSQIQFRPAGHKPLATWTSSKDIVIYSGDSVVAFKKDGELTIIDARKAIETLLICIDRTVK